MSDNEHDADAVWTQSYSGDDLDDFTSRAKREPFAGSIRDQIFIENQIDLNAKYAKGNDPIGNMISATGYGVDALERGDVIAKSHANVYSASLDLESFYHDSSKLISEYRDDGRISVSNLESIIGDSADIMAFLAESTRTPFGVAIGFALTGVGLAIRADQAANGDVTREVDVSALVNSMQNWARGIDDDAHSMVQGLMKVYGHSVGKAVDALESMNESDFNQFLLNSDPLSNEPPASPRVAGGARVHYIPSGGGGHL